MKRIENYILKIFNEYKLEYDLDLIHYAIILVGRYTICIIPAMLISFFLGNSIYFFSFLLSMYLLRTHFGGIHFDNNYLCAFISILILVVVPLINKYVLFSKNQMILISVILLFIFCVLNPQDNYKKRNNKQFTLYHKRKGIIYLVIYFILIVVSKIDISQIILLSIILEFICILLSIICNKFRIEH